MYHFEFVIVVVGGGVFYDENVLLKYFWAVDSSIYRRCNLTSVTNMNFK